METKTFNRRNFLNTSTSAASAAAVLAATGVAFGKDQERKRDRIHTPGTGAAVAEGARTLTPAQVAAYDCLKSCEICLDHCLEAVGKGDTSLANCQRNILICQATCQAFIKAVTGDSPADTLKKLASACAAVCRDCAKACEEHKDHHAECKACMEACLACAKACDAL